MPLHCRPLLVCLVAMTVAASPDAIAPTLKNMLHEFEDLRIAAIR